jgi:hypothetical protein
MGIQLVPFLGYEDLINHFERWMSALVAPGEEATTKMDLFQACIV